MSEGKISLEIVTPRGRALSAEVDEVTAPSVNGEFGLLPGHLPILVALRPGIVSYRQGTETTKCAVGNGFAEGGPDKLLLLTDEYVEKDQVNPVLVEKELAEVEAEIGKLGTDITTEEERLKRKVLVDRENFLATELELYGNPPPPTMRPLDDPSTLRHPRRRDAIGIRNPIGRRALPVRRAVARGRARDVPRGDERRDHPAE